jgi:perosamine synthetase
VLAIGKKRGVPVLEDACQSHLGEWRNRKVGTWGTAGCFSFQASKNLNSGEGGAILTNDERLYERCYAFHTNSSGRRNASFDGYSGPGLNLRMPEFQGALLVAQMSRVEAQSKVREQNAQTLTNLLEQIPGIQPARMYEGCTRNAYHLYMFRYDPQQFARMPRAKFLKALAAEGIPASSGYTPLNKQALLKTALSSRGFTRLFSEQELKQWSERNACPENDKLCEEAVWFTQTMLLGPRSDMETIAAAIKRIQAHAAHL